MRFNSHDFGSGGGVVALPRASCVPIAQRAMHPAIQNVTNQFAIIHTCTSLSLSMYLCEPSFVCNKTCVHTNAPNIRANTIHARAKRVHDFPKEYVKHAARACARAIVIVRLSVRNARGDQSHACVHQRIGHTATSATASTYGTHGIHAPIQTDAQNTTRVN